MRPQPQEGISLGSWMIVRFLGYWGRKDMWNVLLPMTKASKATLVCKKERKNKTPKEKYLRQRGRGPCYNPFPLQCVTSTSRVLSSLVYSTICSCARTHAHANAHAHTHIHTDIRALDYKLFIIFISSFREWQNSTCAKSTHAIV